MSTKTTFKRVALVTVAALGFGMLSTGVAQAAVSTYTASASLSTTSMTIVSSSTSTGAAGKFYVDVTGGGAAADDTTAAYQGLFSGESISVTVVTSPDSYTASTAGKADNLDLTFQALKMTASGSTAADSTGASTFSAVGSALTGAPSKFQLLEPQISQLTTMQAIT